MPAFAIAIVNESSASEIELQKFVDTFPQFLLLFVEHWPDALGTTVRIATKENPPYPTEAVVNIVTYSDVPNSAGYHLTEHGLPLGIVEMAAVVEYDMRFTVVLCHEILELLANPNINKYIKVGEKYLGYENVDPVTSDVYFIGDVAFSSFVFPSYFDLLNTTGPWDLMGSATGPLPSIPKGGALEYNSGTIWAPEYEISMPENIKAFTEDRRNRSGRRFHMKG